jgi:hypothetical protein
MSEVLPAIRTYLDPLYLGQKEIQKIPYQVCRFTNMRSISSEITNRHVRRIAQCFAYIFDATFGLIATLSYNSTVFLYNNLWVRIKNLHMEEFFYKKTQKWNPTALKTLTVLGLAAAFDWGNGFFGGIRCFALSGVALWVLSKMHDEISAQAPSSRANSFSKFHLLQRIAHIALGLRICYALFDAGLARSLGLETLRHGDRFSRYLPDFLFGADPSTRVAGVGSCEGLRIIERGAPTDCFIPTKGYYYVFRDREFAGPPLTSFTGREFVVYFLKPLLKHLLPRCHAVLSGVGGTFNKNAIVVNRYLRGFLGVMDGLLTPTLKFRFTFHELQKRFSSGRMELDPDYNGDALRTKQPISFCHLGISGSLVQLFRDPKGVYEGICFSPLSALFGLGLMAAGAYVAKKTYEVYRDDPHSKKEPLSVRSKIKAVAKLFFLATLSAAI